MNTSAPIGRILQLDGGPVHVREDGPADAKPLLLVHGLPSSMQWFDGLTALLSDTYRIIRVDLRGQGHTGGTDRIGSEAQTRMVSAVLDHLDVNNVAAVAHSFGTDVAVGLGAASKRVSEVIIIDQAPDYSYAGYPPGLGLVAQPPLVRLAQRIAPGAIIRLSTKVAFGPGFRYSAIPGFPDQVVRDFRDMAPAAARVALVHRRRELAAHPLDARVRELEVPTLVIHGRHDRLYNCAKTIDRYAAVGAKTEVVEDAGHSPHVEQPAEVARLLRSFLTDLP